MQLFGAQKAADYRDEMVGTQLVAGAFNKEHQAKLLSETANLHSLEDKLDRLCTPRPSHYFVLYNAVCSEFVRDAMNDCKVCTKFSLQSVKSCRPAASGNLNIGIWLLLYILLTFLFSRRSVYMYTKT